MPIKIADAVKDGEPLVMMEKVTGELAIIQFLEFELIEATSMLNMNPGLLLQKHQVSLVAKMLYDNFKNESIEDFSLALKRGVSGFYNPEGLFRIDGAVITMWVQRYLEEKYAHIESEIQREKAKAKKVEPTDKPVDYNAVRARIEKERAGPSDEQLARYAEIHKDAEHIKFKATLKPNKKFVCDGIEVLAKDEHYAARVFKQEFGREPKTVTLQGEERETPK